MTVEFYVSKTNRDILKNMAVLRGESVLHDDFINSLGMPTNGNTGRLTFGIIPNPRQSRDEIRVKELVIKLNNDTITDRELHEFLSLTILNDVR